MKLKEYYIMKDITEYSNDYLVNLVHDQVSRPDLHKARKDVSQGHSLILKTVNDEFIFTNKQLFKLEEELAIIKFAYRGIV